MSVTDWFQFLLSLLHRIIPKGKIQVIMKIKFDKKNKLLKKKISISKSRQDPSLYYAHLNSLEMAK